MIWWMWIIIILSIIGFIVILPIILRRLGFGIKFIFKFLIYTIVFIVLALLFISIIDSIFNVGWWDTITNWF